MTSGLARFGFFVDAGALVTDNTTISNRWTSLLGSSASTADAISSFTSTFYSVMAATKSTAVGTSLVGSNGKYNILLDPDSETQDNPDFQAWLDMNPSSGFNLINTSLATLNLNLLGKTPYVVVTSGNEIGVFKAGTALPATGGSFDSSYSVAVRGTSVTTLVGLGSTFADGIQTIPEPSTGAFVLFGTIAVAALRGHNRTSI
jgi:hypothetical protein